MKLSAKWWGLGGAFAVAVVTVCVACRDDENVGTDPDSSGPGGDGGSNSDGRSNGDGPNGDDPGGEGGRNDAGDLPVPKQFTMELDPQTSSTEKRRVNFAIPLPPDTITSPDKIDVKAGGASLATARRTLAKWPNGSLRSVQIQIELAVPAKTTLEVSVGDVTASGGDLTAVPVDTLLVAADGSSGPAVWAVLPVEWLAASRLAGPTLPSASLTGAAAAWNKLCDAKKWGIDEFLKVDETAAPWLYDRPTTLYRAYQRSGSIDALKSAYREAAMYRRGVNGTGTGTRVMAPPGISTDLKYHYTQGFALHYLLTGDDRFRKAAEDVGTRAHALWPSPGYNADSDKGQWTERHAGFGLLAYEWAAAVAENPATYTQWAKDAVAAYLNVQSTYPRDYTNTEERCFAHDSFTHDEDEDFGYFGCSPWMSAILADGLEAHADRLARSGDAAGAQKVRTSIVKLGAYLAKRRDEDGKPYYWAGIGTEENEADPDEEHWPESAYVVAMAWYFGGKSNATLKKAADDLIAAFNREGEVPHVRSYNWQCRSSVMTPFFLQP